MHSSQGDRVLQHPIIFMYSGQGSHYYQMGRDLYEADPRFKVILDNADDLYRSLTSVSLLAEIYDNRYQLSTPFINTLQTNPAIYLMEIALTEYLQQLGIVPDAVLGSSFRGICRCGCCGDF